MSEIRANTVSNAAGTGAATLTGQYAAKVWVNFNGTGTVAIRDSGNVTSITDNGTGNCDVNFTTAMTDANYAGLVTVSEHGGVTSDCNGILSSGQPSTSCEVVCRSNGNTAYDPDLVSVATFR